MKVLMLIAFLLICATMQSFGDEINDNKKTNTEFGKVILTEKEIKDYQGFYFHVLIIDNKPLMSVSLESGKKQDNKMNVNSIQVVDVVTNFSQIGKNKIDLDLEALQGFTPALIVLADPESSDNGLDVRFNYLDNEKRIRLSKWYDRKTGFPIKTALYDETGKLFSFSFYKKLIVDKPELENLQIQTLNNVALKDVIKDHEDFDFDQLNGIEKLGTYVLKEVIKQEDVDDSEWTLKIKPI